MKGRNCRYRMSNCMPRLLLCELLIVCQQFGVSAASDGDCCRPETVAVVDLHPSPATLLQDEKPPTVDLSSSPQFRGHFAKRSPVRNVEGLLCTVIMTFRYL